MYKALNLKELFKGNKHSLDYSPKKIINWINAQESIPRRDLVKGHAFSRVRSLYDFSRLVEKEKINVDNVCVISGGLDELELNFLEFNKVFVTSLESGFDLTESWKKLKNFKKSYSENFEFVMCNQVLEHVPDPITAFENIFSLTKKGGYIWISVPVINRIHDEPNFYSSGYHPRYLKFLGDNFGLDIIHIGAWGSLKYKLFSVARNWPPLRKLKIGLRSNSDLLFPSFVFSNGLKSELDHITDTWALYRKK